MLADVAKPRRSKQGVGDRVKDDVGVAVTREAGLWSITVMHNMDLPDPEMADAQKNLEGSKQA